MSVEVAEPQHSFQATLCAENRQSTVKLTENLLFVNLLNERTGATSSYKTYNIRDLIGCKSLRSTPNSSGTEKRKVILGFYALNGRNFREYREVAVAFDGPNSAENSADADRFVDQIYDKLRIFTEANDLGLPTRFYFGSGKRVLFLVNPRSGKRRALKLFCDLVEPALRDAGIRNFDSSCSYKTVASALKASASGLGKSITEPNEPSYELLITSRANDARDFAQSANLAPYYAIVTVSGDGLLYEVVNGLLRRTDWADAVRTPISVLPAGTGNCLAANVIYAAGESTRNMLMNAIYIFLHHNIVPFDIFACELKPKSTAEAQVEQAETPSADAVSEANDVLDSESPQRLVRSQTDAGPIAIEPNLPRSQSLVAANATENLEDNASVEMALDVDQCSALLRDNGGLLYSFFGFMWGLLSEIDIESESLRAFGKLRYPIYAIQRALAPRFRTVSGRLTFLPASALSETELRSAVRERNSDGSLKFRFLPPVDQPIPTEDSKKWCVLEGEFVTVAVLRLSHLVEDSLIAREMNRFDQGFCNLFIAKPGVSRLSILRHLFMFLSGNMEGVAQSDWMMKIPIVALRVEPHDPRGVMTLDGELVPYGTVQLELIPGLARLLAVHEQPQVPHIAAHQDQF